MDKNEELQLVNATRMLHDEKAFARLVHEYQSTVRRFFLSQTLGDSQLSDDLAQDTFVKAYTRLNQFQGKSSFLTWLFRIAYNVFYDHTRSHRPTADLDTPTVKRRESERRDTSFRIDINEALRQLSEQERTCVTLQLMEQQPLEKIAEITGMNINTVKSHVARGKKKMADYLRANGYG
ncbi:MAG: RNA polymerase sigma factor [Prevotella sp.]|jgi:RNA polymerase sigma-70 factor (ECF subfamily)